MSRRSCHLCGLPLHPSTLALEGSHVACFIKDAYDLGVKLDGPGRYDLGDPVQTQLRAIRDWITMAERDALDSRKARA